jgi:hypothetical protein
MTFILQVFNPRSTVPLQKLLLWPTFHYLTAVGNTFECLCSLSKHFLPCVGIQTDYGLDGEDSVPGGDKTFFSLHRPGQTWGPFNLLSNEYKALSPGLESADHSFSSSPKVKNHWSYTSTLPYVLMAQYLTKAHGQLHLSHCHIFSCNNCRCIFTFSAINPLNTRVTIGTN